MAINIGDAVLTVKVNSEDVQKGLEAVDNKARSLEDSFRNVERISKPVGIALTSVGAAGLLAANATKDWDNSLGKVLQALKPAFALMTGFGVLLMTGVKVIKAVRIALEALKVTALSTMSVFGILGLAIAGIGALVAAVVLSFKGAKADTERWSNALDRANSRLREMEASGKGASDEANQLREMIDDLTDSLVKYAKVGDDNKVTIYNLDDATEKLTDTTKALNREFLDTDKSLIDNIKAGKELGLTWKETLGVIVESEIVMGDLTATALELADGIEAVKEEQLAAAEAIRESNISDLEKQYGFRADEHESLLDMLEDDTEAKRTALEDQLDNTRDSISDEIDAYEDAYNEKVRLYKADTDAYIDSLQDQLDALNDQKSETDRLREDEDDAKTEAELRAAIEAAWTRKDRAAAEKELADFLEERSRKLEDRKLEDQREALSDQINEAEEAQNEQLQIWERERNDFNRLKQSELQISERAIRDELTALEAARNTKYSILKQEFDDAVEIHNAIRNSALATINAQMNALMSTAGISSVSLTPQQSLEMQSGMDYENWAATSGGGVVRYEKGGSILEPTLLYGLKSKRAYAIAGEAGRESVVPTGGGTTIYINNPVVREEQDIDRLAHRLGQVLYRQRQMTGSFGVG